MARQHKTAEKSNLSELVSLQLPFMLGRMYDDRTFWKALQPLGMTLRNFRSFLKALGVPSLRIGSKRFIDAFTFAMAIRAVTRIGRKDFAAPGSTALHKGGINMNGCTNRLDIDHVQSKHWEIVLEMALAQRWNRIKNDDKMAKAAKEAIERMRLAIIDGVRYEVLRGTTSRTGPDEDLLKVCSDALEESISPVYGRTDRDRPQPQS
jgi:hypothetical protein